MYRLTILLLMAFVFIAGSLATAAPEGVKAGDYLKLTQENLPPMQVVIQDALDASDFENIPLHQMKKRARQSAWLPRLRLKMDYDLDAYDNWAFTEDARNYTSGPYAGATKQDRWERSDSGDRLSYGAYAEWDLSVFVWEKFDHQLAEKYSKQGGTKRRRIIEVSKRYAVLHALLPSDDSGSVAASDVADVLDNAIYLDVITDYMLSDKIRWMEEEKKRNAMEQVMGEDVEVVDKTQPEPAATETKEAVSSAGDEVNAAPQEKAEMMDFLNSL